ncbi:MAG: hydrogenase expression protein HypE, partial [Candidatus Limnocylindria bacterium]
MTGATNPSVEDLLTGGVSGLPTVVLHHPVLSVENGQEFIRPFKEAADGELDAPYVVIYEGSIGDERLAAQFGGYWSAMGDQVIEGGDRPFPTAERLASMASNAAAVIAIGTCATWGGVPSAIGNPTGAMSVMDFLGADYRSALG